MLTLMLLRHAKAGQQVHDDFGRALTDKGRADASRLGAYLATRGLQPDLALVSAATRTTQTFEIVAAATPRRCPVRFERSLYNATASDLRDVLRPIEPSVRTLMIVGHNPGLMDVAVWLARDGDLLEIDRLRTRFPPSAIAVLSFETDDWLDARASGGRLDLLVLPDDIAEPE